MPDKYWEKVGNDIKKEQKKLLKKGGGRRCERCNKIFDSGERPDSSDPKICASCYDSPSSKSAWRGKGSFGKNPRCYPSEEPRE